MALSAQELFFINAEGDRTTPSVVAFRSHIFELLEREIDRARARGDEDGKVEQAQRHLSGVLLHTPTVRAHELAAAGRAADRPNVLILAMAVVALVLTAINMFGGFAVTRRMLAMFRK